MKNYEKQELRILSFINVKADRIIRQDRVLRPISLEGLPVKKNPSKNPVKRQYHNFIISENSQKNIRSKINWLYRFAKSRAVKTYSGRDIYNFKVSFITLTLPSVQSHPTSEIMKVCFEPLLTLLRNHLKMTNYVWKLEFQKNGNMHIHLLTDTYIDYFYIRQKWNEKLKVLGYIDAYQDKFEKYSLHKYLNEFSDGTKESIDKCCKWFANGKASNWRNPNTADVRPVLSDKQLSYYLAKYVSKTSTTGGNSKHDNEENSFGIRLCFWSRSLSACDPVMMPYDYFEFDFEHLRTFEGSFDYMRYDYCEVLYFRWDKFTDYLKMQFAKLFAVFRKEFGYVPCYG